MNCGSVQLVVTDSGSTFGARLILPSRRSPQTATRVVRQREPATAESGRESGQHAASELGSTGEFRGEGTENVRIVTRGHGDEARCRPGDPIVKVDQRYIRPTEDETLLGNPCKANTKQGMESAQSSRNSWEGCRATRPRHSGMSWSRGPGFRRSTNVNSEHRYTSLPPRVKNHLTCQALRSP